MFNIIPVVIILGALAVMVVILIRRLPQISSLDVTSIPEVKAQEVKKKILDERLKRKMQALGKKFQPALAGVFGKIGGSLKDAKERLENARHQLEKSQVPKRAITAEEVAKKQEFIEETLETAQEMAEEDNFEAAEKRFIDVISHDPSNLEAYEGLAELYIENEKINEAIETLRYVKKLNPNSTQVMWQLSELYEQAGNIEKSLAMILQAVEHEPRNPKYLDRVVELSLAAKQKQHAQYFLQQLAEVNPENQKLQDLQKMVDEL